MDSTTVDLMHVVARLHAGESVEQLMATVPQEHRERLSEIISIAVIGEDGQLEGIQPIDYMLPTK